MQTVTATQHNISWMGQPEVSQAKPERLLEYYFLQTCDFFKPDQLRHSTEGKCETVNVNGVKNSLELHVGIHCGTVINRPY